MKKNFNKKGLTAAVLAMAMLALTACGGASDSETEAAADTSTEAAAEAEGTETESAAEAETTGTGKSITMAIISGGDTFNPLAADTNGDDYMQILIWDRPFITKLDGSIETPCGRTENPLPQTTSCGQLRP